MFLLGTWGPLVSGDSRGDEKFTGKRGEDKTGRASSGDFSANRSNYSLEKIRIKKKSKKKNQKTEPSFN